MKDPALFDRLVAEHVMGRRTGEPRRHYSTDPSVATEVLQRLPELYWRIEYRPHRDGQEDGLVGWRAAALENPEEFADIAGGWAYAPTWSRAVCLAALRAVGVEV